MFLLFVAEFSRQKIQGGIFKMALQVSVFISFAKI